MINRIAIVGASEEELNITGSRKTDLVHKRIANFDFYEGEIMDKPVVILITGWGKVRAAQSIMLLKHYYSVSQLFFIGACGGIGEWRRGDICIPALFDYYDFNVFPLLKSYHYPQFESHGHLHLSPVSCMPELTDTLRSEFNRVYYGLALTGDSFVSDTEVIHRTGKLDKFYHEHLPKMTAELIGASKSSLNLPLLLKNAPRGAIIDMESTAIAETCTNLNVDFLIIRIVTDSIDADSHTDFTTFLSETMPRMADTILSIICK